MRWRMRGALRWVGGCRLNGGELGVFVDLLGSKNRSEYEKKREHGLPVSPASSTVVEVGVRGVS